MAEPLVEGHGPLPLVAQSRNDDAPVFVVLGSTSDQPSAVPALPVFE